MLVLIITIIYYAIKYNPEPIAWVWYFFLVCRTLEISYLISTHRDWAKLPVGRMHRVTGGGRLKMDPNLKSYYMIFIFFCARCFSFNVIVFSKQLTFGILTTSFEEGFGEYQDPCEVRRLGNWNWKVSYRNVAHSWSTFSCDFPGGKGWTTHLQRRACPVLEPCSCIWTGVGSGCQCGHSACWNIWRFSTSIHQVQ